MVRTQLDEYFRAERREFTVPLHTPGTPFQNRVWAELQRIPIGTTTTYAAVARNIGQPTAVRAVARANGDNRIAIIIPCHRVIGSDGSLTGYGGGLSRKQQLLDLEGGVSPGARPADVILRSESDEGSLSTPRLLKLPSRESDPSSPIASLRLPQDDTQGSPQRAQRSAPVSAKR